MDVDQYQYAKLIIDERQREAMTEARMRIARASRHDGVKGRMSSLRRIVWF